ncbi:MAG: hypothetical protein GWN06_07305, partial [Gemmatimonadetes bacterium]|nr:hypothetical protein [Gemmatimonadota bacterium]
MSDSLEAWLFLALVLLALFLIGLYRERGGPIPYRGRACTGRAWKRAFPGATSDQVRAFLRCLVDGMGITRAATLKFHPQD